MECACKLLVTGFKSKNCDLRCMGRWLGMKIKNLGVLPPVNILFDKMGKCYLSFKGNDSISCFSSIINCSESPILSVSHPELRFEPKRCLSELCNFDRNKTGRMSQLLFTRKMWKFIAAWIFPVQIDCVVLVFLYNSRAKPWNLCPIVLVDKS